MRLIKFTIEHFRSMEEVEIIFPENIPVILFGPNNVGKSNILKSLEYMLGEKSAAYVEFQDSDYYLRDSKNYPNISYRAYFDSNFYSGNYKNPPSDTVCFSTNIEIGGKSENTFHYPTDINNGGKIYLSNLDKEKLKKSPRKEVLRLFDIAIERESQIKDKIQLFRKFASIILFVPKVRKFAKEYLMELDLEKIKPDTDDDYWAGRRAGYNWKGIDWETRRKQADDLDKRLGNVIIK